MTYLRPSTFVGWTACALLLGTLCAGAGADEVVSGLSAQPTAALSADLETVKSELSLIDVSIQSLAVMNAEDTALETEVNLDGRGVVLELYPHDLRAVYRLARQYGQNTADKTNNEDDQPKDK